MILINDILITEKVRNDLGSQGIILSMINHKNLENTLRKNNLKLWPFTWKDWNKFKKSENYNQLQLDIDQLYELGYGSKFISLCLSIKYNRIISHQIIHRKIKGNCKSRISYSINEKSFSKGDIIIKGRVFFSRGPGSTYLAFKCLKIKNLAKKKRMGVKVTYNKDNDKVFLERDDRSAKKAIVREEEIFVSLYPVPKELRDYLLDTNKSYKSSAVEVHFNSNNFGFNREELIDDRHARILYTKLKKLGFALLKERITNASRSKGDLVVFKNDKKLVIEITNIGDNIQKNNKYVVEHHYRDLLIGKIIRITTLNDCITVFVLNSKIELSIINEDFRKIIEKFKISIILTDFREGWENAVANKIDILFENK